MTAALFGILVVTACVVVGAVALHWLAKAAAEHCNGETDE